MYNAIYKELSRLEKEGRSIRVAAVGTGFIGRGMIIQSSYMKGIKVSIIYGRDVNKLIPIVGQMKGKPNYKVCKSSADLRDAEDKGVIALVDDINRVYLSNADIVVDTTGGAPRFGADVAYNSIMAGKHIVTNPEMDICIGTQLKKISR